MVQNGWLNRESVLLEDEFFRKQDKALIDKLQLMKKMKETKQALAEVSGISNEKILERLVELDIHPEIVAAMAVVPLIEVAWADGSIDEKEKKAVLHGAERSGVKAGSIEFDLIERWLVQRPGPKLLEAWVHYIEGLCEKLTPEEKQTLKTELLHNTRMIAEASGGFLGFFKVSKAEKEILRKLDASFK